MSLLVRWRCLFDFDKLTNMQNIARKLILAKLLHKSLLLATIVSTNSLAAVNTMPPKGDPFSETSNVSAYLHKTVDENWADVNWYAYRNTIVAFDDTGTPMCIALGKEGDDKFNCKRAGNIDPATMASFIEKKVKNGEVLTCNSSTYLQKYPFVPTSDITGYGHWCNEFRAEGLTVRAGVKSGRLVFNKDAYTWNFSSEKSLNTSWVGFLIPPQTGASGPTRLENVRDFFQYSTINVMATNLKTKSKENIVLRGTRHLGCGHTSVMYSNTPCYDFHRSQLRLSFTQEDNRSLPAGDYIGSFNVDVSVYGEKPKSIPVFVDVSVSD
jgi:hypothetical protein